MNRQRLQKNLQQQPIKEWLTTILSSGESSLLEHTKNNTGLKVRVIEFCEPVTLSADHSNKCKNFFLNNYGHIGVEIVSYLKYCNLTEWVEVYKQERENFLANVHLSDKSPLTERLADSFTIIMLTAQILEECGYNIQSEEMLKILLIKNEEIGNSYNIGQSILDKIFDRIVNKRNLYPTDSTYFGLSNIEGVVYPNGEIVLLESTFNKIVAENNFSSKLVCLRALDKMGALKRQRNDTYYSKRIINKIPVKALVINLNIMNKKGELI